ncbi:energy-coupling factor transporter transmembrane component T family protein [Actinoalloteichus hymeniacidonis]|uniref:ABC-type cobalt transport system, permease component CbiQ n=1 Tax=Actinoalloteichus hymeniacidonis TaxID=340345 RepID=A0AAC9HMK9_9PSEU|nr:energy-coupling factor transporter transmembrane component T [Actinoalloteichus hymeniacidonis]AOS61946.1 ABC-type cobalt transport system, permease component CbiQ [Actinoalloteichus hymeniacidonis]MBB5910034.1 energy-coupling factor transport system permease protein [Actinoalloteichus hymeniacidonis]
MTNRKQHDVLSVEWVKLELIRTAYATRGGLFATMDPRMVIGWYLVFAVAPWLTHNLTVLALLFAAGVVSIVLARVGPLILGLFVIGLGLELLYIVIAASFFGGDLATLVALLELTLKLGAVSLASMAAFVSLDPEKLSDALLALRMPSMLAFGVSYGYRMLPILIEEFSTVFEGYRLRSAAPARRGLLGWRVLVHWSRLVVLCFYPIFLNTAKSVRTTVEALETRGFTYATVDGRGRRIRLSYLRFGFRDYAVLAGTVLCIVGFFWAGAVWPVYRTAG